MRRRSRGVALSEDSMQRTVVRRLLAGLALPAGLPAALVLTLGASAGAQTTTGNLRGYVTGASGVPVADVQVAARALDNNQSRGTLTNASGFYYIGGLRP